MNKVLDTIGGSCSSFLDQSDGYTPYLQAIDALDAEGRPLHKAGVSAVPGLYYVALDRQCSFASAP